MLELHVFVPQMQVCELREFPLVPEHTEMAEDEHWLYVLLQNIPLIKLQALVSQEQSIVLIDAPIWLGQALPPEQVLLEESQ